MRRTASILSLILLMTSCQRSSSQTWEDTKTFGRCVQQGLNAICGKYEESKQVATREDFCGPEEKEFIALQEADLKGELAFQDPAIIQSKESLQPVPSLLETNNSLFKPVHFQTDDHVIREANDLKNVDAIVKYMKKNPKMQLQVEGHCDKRASSAYNMALGMRRANHLRVLLIKKGIDYNRIYTVSYGKEKPVAAGNDTKAYALNRRSEFKFFTKD